MSRWIRKALGLCVHKWSIVKEVHCTERRYHVNWTEYHLQCDHCGEMKKWGKP